MGLAAKREYKCGVKDKRVKNQLEGENLRIRAWQWVRDDHM